MKRFFRLKSTIKINRKTKTMVGIAGVMDKVGVTHISLSLANLLCSGLKQRVLYIELSNNSQLLSLVGEQPVDICGHTGYIYKGVNYLLQCSVQEAKEAFINWDGSIIVDISTLSDDTLWIFNQCKSQIVIGSMKPWCKKHFYLFINNMKGHIDINNIRFFNKSTIINERERKEFRSEFSQNLATLPDIHDPFHLKESDFKPLLNMIY